VEEGARKVRASPPPQPGQRCWFPFRSFGFFWGAAQGL
jgi:hypothetical protein